jgi:DKNYY family protein
VSAGSHVAFVLAMGLIAWLLGCSRQEGPFQQKDGAWYYNATPIAQADAKSFRALGPHYAKDKARVYWAETYRTGQDYFTTRRDRVIVVDQAEAATFTPLKGEYARDRSNVFFEGMRFAVSDVGSFEVLDYGFARDRVRGYFHQVAVPDSDGATFAALDTHYARDRTRVFHGALEPGTGGKPPVRRIVELKGARADAFSLLDGGYAKTDTQVYHAGRLVPGADAASFAILESPTQAVDAKDRTHTYQQGRRTTGSRSQ